MTKPNTATEEKILAEKRTGLDRFILKYELTPAEINFSKKIKEKK